MGKIRGILIYSFLMGIVTGFSQTSNSFIAPSVINICVPPGPNNTYPDADIQTNVVTVTGSVTCVNIVNNNVERSGNHPVFKNPVTGQFIGVGMPANAVLAAGSYEISFHPVHDPGPNGRTGTVTFSFGAGANVSTHVITVNITRCGSQQQSPQQQSPQRQWGQLHGQYSRISVLRGTVCILRRRFNPKTGVIEVAKNGVISHRGYLNLQAKNLNRRQALRNYRFR